jgi:hypothetical protein
MIDAENKQEYRNFFKSVYGALFFGVPSQGMETAALETVMKDQANLPLVTNLRKDVQALTDQFNSVIKRQGLHMEYFYEAKETPQLVKVSLTLGLPSRALFSHLTKLTIERTQMTTSGRPLVEQFSWSLHHLPPIICSASRNTANISTALREITPNSPNGRPMIQNAQLCVEF